MQAAPICVFIVLRLLYRVPTPCAGRPGGGEHHRSSAEPPQSIDGDASSARDIGRRFHPKRVVLFGSYASGIPTEDSDVDLLVILQNQGRNVEKAFEISRAIPHPFPMDLIVIKPHEVTRRLKGGDLVLREMIEKGTVLYEARH